MSNEHGKHPLLGRNLRNFKVVERVLVEMRFEGEGTPVGIFTDADLAQGYRDTIEKGKFGRTRRILVLVNGRGEAYAINGTPLHIFDEENVRKSLTKRAMEKLTPAEQKILKPT